MLNKVKYNLEIPFQASPQMIFQYISDATGLSEWFANKVTVSKDIYTFTWDDEELQARLCLIKNNEKVRFIWLDENKKETDCFFEIKINVDEITNDISLFIIDFAFPDEIEAEKALWKSIVNDFKHIIGAE
jgi:hypothetical protein